MQDNDRQQLLNTIGTLIYQKGLRGMTMDSVAKALGISKRTLYQLFDSKDDMVRDVFRHFHSHHTRKIKKQILNSANSMEAMAIALNYHMAIMKNINIELLRDMDNQYHHLRIDFEKNHSDMCHIFMDAFSKGVEQGVFRNDIDYRITLRLFTLQIESLKRMEELFPSDVTLPDAYRHIILSMLRSVATPKGLEVLENLNEDYNNNPEKYLNNETE